MRKKRKSRGLAAWLIAAMLTCLLPQGVWAAGSSSGSSWVPDGDIMIKNTKTQIAPGVTEYELVANTEKGNDQKIDYLCEIDLKGTSTTKMVAAYGSNYSTDRWELVSTTKQAEAYEAKTGETVVAAINADFFNMATGEPQGALVMDGEVRHSANGRSYFAVLKDGTPVIRTGDVSLEDCQIAVGGDQILIQDGKLISQDSSYGAEDYSRTAIGIKADGTVVTFVTHGRIAPVSCGRTYAEIAQIFYNMGCVSALTLDGGGSSTYCARPEGSDRLEIRNSPSDGAEREVSSTLLVVSTAKPTGVFDHAAITPNNEVYTPGSQIQFKAHGVDSAGTAVDMPAGLSWALAKDSQGLGSIDGNTGVLTAGSDTGRVTVELKQGNEVVGSTSIEIAVPDQISFPSDEVSLGFEETTDFNIVVRNQGRDIHYKEGDLVWSCSDERMGSFNGNLFTSSDGESLNGNVKAVSAFDETVEASLHVIVGMLPTIVWDFEDYVNAETGKTVSAAEYYTGENGVLTHSNYNRGGKESIEIISIDDDEPVRFGSHALKLNYDFINCGEVTEGACIGTTEAMTIPGSPTAIGVWVYAPEGTGVTWKGDGTTAGFWLRGYVRDGAGNNMPYDFTLEPKNAEVQSGAVQPGIYWEGWHYCEADLTKLTGPFSIQKGMTFRLMYVAGTKMGTKTAGSIYFDNLQFVYGANVDDVDSPVIDSIMANNEPLENGMTISAEQVTFDAFFHDVENKYTSGIDTSTIRMYLDGVNVVDNENFTYAADPDGTRNHLYDVRLLNGSHSLTISVRDQFGNETSETRYFTVNTEQAAGIVSVQPREAAANLGGVLHLDIVADDTAAVLSSQTTLKLGNQFKDYTVSFSADYEGNSRYNKLTDSLVIEAARKDTAAEESNVIATVEIPIPASLSDSAVFTYTVKAGSYTTADGFFTYSSEELSLPVAAYYMIEAEPVLVGSNAVIHVTTADGEAAAQVDIFRQGGAKVGTTDENGILTTDAFSEKVGKYVIYAKNDGKGISFNYTIQTFDGLGAPDGTPFVILNNAVTDAATQKNLSWLSSANHTGVQTIQYAQQGSEEWKTVEAKTVTRTFATGDPVAVRVSSVRLTGLTPGMTYRYKVGSAEGQSQEQMFTTGGVKNGVNFFILGDIQSEDLTNIEALIGMIRGGNYDFGVQTGDAVDDATRYSCWEGMMNLFDAKSLGDTDLIYVLGNHEYAGDGSSSIASAIYNLPEAKAGSYYSVTYGNVYAAVINYTGTGGQLREALEWLKADAAASDARWKILLMHQPSYYTNVVGGNAEINAQVPPVAEEAGIDFVFSGHDHSYARTEPLLGGQVNQENGVVYYICGSSGEKSYSVTDNPDFHFAKLSDDYTGIYLSVETTLNTFTVNTYEVDGSLLDSYTKEKPNPCKDGHKVVHYENDVLRCQVCGEVMERYTGLAMDQASGKEMYYISGTYRTGWANYGDTMYHFGEDGLAHEVTEEKIPTTCTERGMIVYQCECGASKKMSDVAAPGHSYEQQEDGSFICSICGHRRIELSECSISLPYTQSTYSGGKKSPYPVVIAPDGTQLTGGQVDFFTQWEDNIEVGEARVIVTAKSGYLTNLTEYRGDYGGSVTLTFTIYPDLPKWLTAETIDDTSVRLSWEKAKAADRYTVYYSTDGENWKKAGSTEQAEYEVTGLNQSTAYYFRVRSGKTGANGKNYQSLKYTNVVEATTAKGTDLSEYSVVCAWSSAAYSGNEKKPGVTVKDAQGKTLKKGTDYTVSYENNVNVGTATVIVTGKGAYYGTAQTTFAIKAQSLTNTAAAQAEDTSYNPFGETSTTFTVTDKNGRILVEGADYTVSYTGNAGIGVATAKIKGTGNYKGTLTAQFTISPCQIQELSGYVNPEADRTYTGQKHEPGIFVDGLLEGRDYTVAYENNVNAGTATATLTGQGNFEGSQTVSFEIEPRSLENTVITDGSTYSYTGSAIEADLNVVDDNGQQLLAGKDYQVQGYENNVECGVAAVTLEGIGNYTGTARHEFEIQSADMNTLTVVLEPDHYVYSGGLRKPEVKVLNAGEELLKPEQDYTVEYKDNRQAGTASVTVTGVGNYQGSVVRNFVIEPANLEKCSVTLSYEQVGFTGGKKKPTVVVKTAKGTVLKKNVNYQVTYQDNKNAGTATVIVEGINNYQGVVEKTFTITPANLEACTVTVAEDTYYADKTAHEPAVTVKTAKGTVLKNGVSYEVEYQNNTDEGTATVLVRGIRNYGGTVSRSFTILPAPKTKDLSSYTMTLNFTRASYSGNEKRPKVTVVTPKGTVLANGKNYTVTYTNNTEVGTATVTIQGIGKYTGSITKTFRIVPTKPEAVSTLKVTKTTAKVTFNRSAQADKYYIYVNGKYTGAALTKDYYTIKNLTPGTTYQVSIKAVKEINGKKYYSSASKEVSVTTQK